MTKLTLHRYLSITLIFSLSPSDLAVVEMTDAFRQPSLFYHLGVRESFSMANNIILYCDTNSDSLQSLQVQPSGSTGPDILILNWEGCNSQGQVDDSKGWCETDRSVIWWKWKVKMSVSGFEEKHFGDGKSQVAFKKQKKSLCLWQLLPWHLIHQIFFYLHQ